MAAKPIRRRSPIHLMLPTRRRSAGLLWWFLPIVAIAGWFYPYLGFLMLICMMAPLIVATFRGRYWCGWMCPRGAFLDYIMARFSRNKPAPAWLRSTSFRVGALIFLMSAMSFQLVHAWPNPQAIGRVFITLLTVTTVVGIGLAIAYKPRTWCGFCPMGTLSSWISLGKKPLTVASSCRDCSACAKLCPMTLTPHKQDTQSRANCIKCAQCVTRCPQKALAFTVTPQRPPLRVIAHANGMLEVVEAQAAVCGLPEAQGAVCNLPEAQGAVCSM